MASKRLAERTFADANPRVDEEAGMLFGVKLLGEKSENNRLYGKEVREAALSKYKGLKVYVDDGDFHQAGNSKPGSMQLWAGTVKEAYNRADGIYGDVKLRKKSSFYEGILEAANDEDFSRNLGCSHVADGDVRMEGDVEIVESLNEVFNVALVMEPATTAGMWESKDMANENKRQTKTVKQILEGEHKTKWAKLLKEQVDAGMVDAGMAVEMPAEEADPAAEVEAALEKAAIAVLRKMFSGDLEEAAAMSEIKKILGMKEEVVQDEGGSETPDTPATESVKADAELGRLREQVAKLTNQTTQLSKESAELKAKNLLLESGREATQPRIKALAAAAEGDRQALLESWPKQQPGVERPDRSPPLYDDGEYDTELPEDAEKFAAMILR